MIVHPVKVTAENGRCRVSANIQLEKPGKVFSKTGCRIQELWFDWPEDYCEPSADNSDPFFLVCLTLAMRLRERLEIQGVVSQSLLLNSLEAMSIYQHYFPKICDPVPIDATSVCRPKHNGTRVGSFYSGGVDSLYNIAESKRLNLKYGSLPVTDLWLVQGMDISLENLSLWEQVKTTMFTSVRPDDNVRCVDVRTNARDIHDRYVAWTKLGFSAVLGALAKCFSHTVQTALIGSYAKYDDVVPHASSPLVDPMWSCDQQLVRHFSCRVNRQEKIDTIADYTPHLLAALRVCYVNSGNAYNCGSCEKCIRTKAQLLIGGHFDKVVTFDKILSPESFLQLRLPFDRDAKYTWDFWRDIRLELHRLGHFDLERALVGAMRRNKVNRYLNLVSNKVKKRRESGRSSSKVSRRPARS